MNYPRSRDERMEDARHDAEQANIHHVKPRCHFCNEPASEFCEHIAIDADVGDEGEAVALYGDVWMCKDCIEDYNNREGLFDPYNAM